ncbi:hypothetical protein HC891_22850 [Candidatus Gracilibacteria bacterium]|nr:hypothetical protein [Candidatus Gracilibacteria bacterium]
MTLSERVLWLIAGKDDEADAIRALLESEGALQVRIVKPRPALEDYSDLAADSTTAGVIVGHLKRRRNDLTYDVIDVLDYLRTLRAELPLFLLTNKDTADLEERAGAADAVFTVRELEQHPHVYISRMQRALGRYEAALSQQQQRLRALLDRQIADNLTSDESDELAGLQAELERAHESRVVKAVERQQRYLSEQKSLIAQLEAVADRLDRLANEQ